MPDSPEKKDTEVTDTPKEPAKDKEEQAKHKEG
jgi:hypothetical protein